MAEENTYPATAQRKRQTHQQALQKCDLAKIVALEEGLAKMETSTRWRTDEPSREDQSKDGDA